LLENQAAGDHSWSARASRAPFGVSPNGRKFDGGIVVPLRVHCTFQNSRALRALGTGGLLLGRKIEP